MPTRRPFVLRLEIIYDVQRFANPCVDRRFVHKQRWGQEVRANATEARAHLPNGFYGVGVRSFGTRQTAAARHHAAPGAPLRCRGVASLRAPAARARLSTMDVPLSLRRFFAVAGAVDLLLGFLLVLVPAALLGSLSWAHVDTVTARLAGAALFAIGARTYAARSETSSDAFRALLDLQILWRLVGAVGLTLAMGDGGPPATAALLAHFVAFAGIFIYYRVRMKQLAAITDDEPFEAAAEDDGAEEGESDEGDADDDLDAELVKEDKRPN